MSGSDDKPLISYKLFRRSYPRHSLSPHSTNSNSMAGLNFTLSPLAAQRVHDALSCLSKFSEYVSLEARRNRLILSALNSSKSAYGGITLASGKFFDTYHFPAMTGGGGGGVGRAGEEPRFTCRFFVKVSKANRKCDLPLPLPFLRFFVGGLHLLIGSGAGGYRPGVTVSVPTTIL